MPLPPPSLPTPLSTFSSLFQTSNIPSQICPNRATPITPPRTPRPATLLSLTPTSTGFRRVPFHPHHRSTSTIITPPYPSPFPRLHPPTTPFPTSQSLNNPT
mmetsp:Transcript_2884/g.8516  ORF Transcript_2884/g.8516 Transcript_2884/m.8516 type:complete len:102 (+) Transcript_2884:260-565(+)